MRCSALALVTVLTLTLLRPAAAQEWPGAPAHLTLVDGEVLTRTSGTSAWVPVTANLPLTSGDWVWVVGRGRAEMRMSVGISIRLGDRTRLMLRALPAADARLTRISVEHGVATISLAGGKPQHLVEVELGQASVRADPPAIFRSEVHLDGSLQISVHSGWVAMETAAGPIEVGSRQTVRLEPGRALRVSALVASDESDRWKEIWDRPPPSLSSVSYLPAELASYAPDFLAFGRWAWTPEYGYVWVPRVSPEWAPYQQGRWLWWREEYVWVADEPWGWVPYHYGRWLFYPPIGWVWVPPAEAQVTWNPGAVAWIVGPGFVAWCPLAPGEVFIEHQDSGPASVNITNIQVTKIHVTNVFINARVANAVIVVPRDAFLAGRRASGSRLRVADVFVAGGRVVHELPLTLRTVKTAVSPGLPKSIAAPTASPKRLDSNGGVFSTQPSLVPHPGQPLPLTQSPARILPQAAGGLGRVGADRPSRPTATGYAGVTTPPQSMPQPTPAVTPPAHGIREAGSAPGQHAPSSPGNSSPVSTGSSATPTASRSSRSVRY